MHTPRLTMPSIQGHPLRFLNMTYTYLMNGSTLSVAKILPSYFMGYYLRYFPNLN